MNADRIGPDVPTSHWKLFFKGPAEKLCAAKLKAFGEGAEIRPYSYFVFCSKISLGKAVAVRPGSMFFACEEAEIIIGDYVLLGPGIHIYTNNHRFSDRSRLIYFQDHLAGETVVVKEGAWIGANVIILPGVTIGRNAVIGAGAVVTKNIPDESIAVGNPAKVIKQIGE